MPRQPRKPREIDEARNHILDAAARVFGAKGFDAATMQEIAAAAGYSAPTLYSYFKGKQTILDALQARHRDYLHELMEPPLPAGTTLTLRERLELWLRHVNAWLERNRDTILLNMRHPQPELASGNGKPSRWDIYGMQLVRMEAWIRKNTQPEELHGRDASEVALVFGGIQQAFFLKWMREGAQTSMNDYVPIVLDMFLFGLCGQPAPTPNELPTIGRTG